MTVDERSLQLAAALAACPDLRASCPRSEAVWLAMRDSICTRSRCSVTPLGGTAPITVTNEYAGQELSEAMTWLRAHEELARSLSPTMLFRHLRGAATKGANGSARMAQQDALHGVTHVMADDSLAFVCFESEPRQSEVRA